MNVVIDRPPGPINSTEFAAIKPYTWAPIRKAPTLYPIWYTVAKLSASKYLSYSTLYASRAISWIEEKKYIKQAKITTWVNCSFGSTKDNVRSKHPSETWANKSHERLKPSNLYKIGIFNLFINGDHKKFNATISEDTVTKPTACLLIPAVDNQVPKGIPKAKLGIAAEMPKKRKLNCVFFNLLII